MENSQDPDTMQQASDGESEMPIPSIAESASPVAVTAGGEFILLIHLRPLCLMYFSGAKSKKTKTKDMLFTLKNICMSSTKFCTAQDIHWLSIAMPELKASSAHACPYSFQGMCLF